VPGRQLIVRLLALSLYLIGVAVALWLLDVRPLLVVAGMALALAIAWTIEWLAWRSGTDLASRAPEPRAAPPEPEPEPERQPAPAPPGSFLPQTHAGEEREPEREAPPEPAPPVPQPKPPPVPAPGPEPPPRPDLRSVPPPVRPPAAPPPPPREPETVVPLPRSPHAREWNLWDLERLAREEVRRDPSQREEWSYLFMHLRQFASADGLLPSEFDRLVRESFGRLVERSPSG
jgi:outer membrane biosynthesis protein TonB